jgi:hypothetical protein
VEPRCTASLVTRQTGEREELHLIGVTPDLDGLQGFPGRRIHVPRADHLKPNRDFPAQRYALFRRAS